MTSEDTEVIDQFRAQLGRYAGDERMKSLFLYGAWTDQQESPCECCATPIAVLEMTWNADLTDVRKQWVELIRPAADLPNGVALRWYPPIDLMFRDHTPERCRSLRETRRSP